MPSAVKVHSVRKAGAKASENVGISSEQTREKRVHRMPKVSYARKFRVGLVGPKPRARAVGDGQPVYIPVPPSGRYERWGDAVRRVWRGVGDAVVQARRDRGRQIRPNNGPEG